MGGRVLEYEAKTILRKGREEGREEGIRGTVTVLKELGIPGGRKNFCVYGN